MTGQEEEGGGREAAGIEAEAKLVDRLQRRRGHFQRRRIPPKKLLFFFGAGEGGEESLRLMERKEAEVEIVTWKKKRRAPLFLPSSLCLHFGNQPSFSSRECSSYRAKEVSLLSLSFHRALGTPPPCRKSHAASHTHDWKESRKGD